MEIKFFRKKIFKILLSLPNEVIVNSLEFKNEYKSKFDLNPICIHNPLDKDAIKKKSKEKIRFNFFQNYKGLKIIFIGRLVDQKDPLTFLKALSFIKNKINFRAVIIGKGYLYKELKKFIEINDLSKQIKILNWKKNPYPYMKQSDMLALTSKYEGLPNTLLEAIVLKKFIISTKCPTGPKEILDYGKGGELIEIKDYKNLIKKIIEYNMNKKKFYKKMLFANQRLIRFNYNKNLNKYSDMTKNILFMENKNFNLKIQNFIFNKEIERDKFIILEFGVREGRSTKMFLDMIKKSGNLISIDIDDYFICFPMKIGNL